MLAVVKMWLSNVLGSHSWGNNLRQGDCANLEWTSCGKAFYFQGGSPSDKNVRSVCQHDTDNDSELQLPLSPDNPSRTVQCPLA